MQQTRSVSVDLVCDNSDDPDEEVDSDSQHGYMAAALGYGPLARCLSSSHSFEWVACFATGEFFAWPADCVDGRQAAIRLQHAGCSRALNLFRKHFGACRRQGPRGLTTDAEG